MKAAFPHARYCLSSATLTDAYVKDILSTKALPGLTHIFTFFITGSLMISREDTRILFRPPTRPNIFLQVDVRSIEGPLLHSFWNSLNIFTSKVREHELVHGDDHEPLLAFLVPLLAEESGLKVQAFFRQKDLLNETSMTIFSLWNQDISRIMTLLCKVLSWRLQLKSWAWNLSPQTPWRYDILSPTGPHPLLIRNWLGTMRGSTRSLLWANTGMGRFRVV